MLLKTPKHVWIVEKDNWMAHEAKEVLDDLGCSATIFKDLDSLLKRYQDSPKASAVIINEQCLDKGFQHCIETISKELDCIPVIISSDVPDEMMWVNYVQKGAVDLIGRPYKGKQIIKALRLAAFRTTNLFHSERKLSKLAQIMAFL